MPPNTTENLIILPQDDEDAVEAIVEEALREIENVDSLAPELGVEGSMVRIEARDRNRHDGVVHADLVGVDDRLGRHRHDEQLHAVRVQLPVEAQDHREGIEGVQRSARQVTKLGHGEEPALSPRDRVGGARLRLGRERPVGDAELGREVGRGVLPAGGCERGGGQGRGQHPATGAHRRHLGPQGPCSIMMRCVC